MTDPDLIVILPESKEAYVALIDVDLLWMAIRHLQTVCETAQISELSVSNGSEMLTATFAKLKHKIQNEPMGIFIQQVGKA